jgi:DMSO/TMAO reductase YedYZ heme-binding membrane subunit
MSRWFQGWRLVGVACAALVASQALLLAAGGGTDEAGLRVLVAGSARISVVLFLLVFVAAPARRFWQNDATRWLLRNRRYLGVSFGIAHFIHLFDIALLALLLGDAFEIDAATLYGGGLAYVLLAAMMATSSDRSARWLGPRYWKWLHRAGLYWLWFIFMQSYTGRAVQMPEFVPLAAAVWGALGLRIAAWRARRARAGAAAAVPAS